MPGEQVVSYYEALIERMPKTGLAAARAVGLISRIVALVESFDSLIARASCVAERSRGCRPSEGKPCSTGCASIVVAPNAIWKYHSSAFSAVALDSTLRISTKNAGLVIERGRAVVELPSGDSKVKIEIDLSSVDGIMREYYTMMYALKAVEAPLRKAAGNLARCSKEKQLAC